MKKLQIFTDKRGRRWICGEALRIIFGIVEVGSPKFWDYDKLCKMG